MHGKDIMAVKFWYHQVLRQSNYYYIIIALVRKSQLLLFFSLITFSSVKSPTLYR